MSTGIVAASAAAAALYYYWKNKGLENGVTAPAAVEAYRTVEHAPNSWTEALSHVKEVFRCAFAKTTLGS